MTFDELVAKVIANRPPSERLSATVIIAETLTQLGVVVDEPTGQLIDRGKVTWKEPQQQNVRYRGMRSRRGKR